MRIKLISIAIILICLSSSVMAGLLSVHRSEGRIISPEVQAKIEAFFSQYDIEFPELPDFLTQ